MLSNSSVVRNEADPRERVAFDGIEKDDSYGQDEGNRPSKKVKVSSSFFKLDKCIIVSLHLTNRRIKSVYYPISTTSACLFSNRIQLLKTNLDTKKSEHVYLKLSNSPVQACGI